MAEPNARAPPADQAGARGAPATLPKFWASSPAAWFRTADAYFALRGINDEIEKFYMVLCSLSETNIDSARHIIEAEPTADSFQQLREALVASHTMTEFQKVDQIVNMEPLNGRKPSELLAAMSKFRPADDKHFFAYHFLQRLPREVCVLLSRESVDNMQALAEKADGFMALHRPQQHDVAAVAVSADGGEDEGAVAAVKKAANKKAANKKRFGKQRAQRSRSASIERRSPLCWLHIRFGDKARRCEQPCAWPSSSSQQEN
jgi:hypothetical protein